MHLKTEDLTRIEIEYDSGIIPPPYSHIFKLKIGLGKNFLNTHLDLHYTDREDLSEEEIFEEGFSLNDDYQFQGEVPKVWESPLKELYANSKWSNSKSNDQGGVSIIAKDTHGKIVRSVPLNQQDWQFFAQDYIQAIYELNKKEAPLRINYLINDEKNSKEISLTVKFSIRKVEVLVNNKAQEMRWEDAKKLLANIFLPDYDYDQASEQKPKQKGEFIDCGDGYWHNMKKGVFNIDDSFDAVSRIIAGFRNLG
ncbi:hypothetical protein A33Q_2965 [Indibacter alkaliphilus LW1]|uniref:Uncharacterized protein n=1 Tax=Indibacter alkaliphilus (strain CCUG 57479 / KCTC 22604 / LW1) TaxID=1189612 RepID=S2E0M5_INDAL|nr:hypothetical protein [Indibacter alkaliphilus]EOZ95603.1 hypothetical protein A33Q_2965 [Indibacter alkaliphilus LW1]